jgi:flagellar motor switch protein FliM
MAAANPIPAPGGDEDGGLGPVGASELAADEGREPVCEDADAEEVAAPKSPVARLPVEVEVTLPVRDFRVRSLLALAPGDVIETGWANGDDLPLLAGDVQLAWSEFEVIEAGLAVRVTRLA